MLAPFVVQGPRVSEEMRGHILDFLAYLEFERNLSRNTLEAYRSDLLQLGAYLDRVGVAVTDVRHEHLAAFLAQLAEGGKDRAPVAAATLQRKTACLRSFFRHLRREEVMTHDPTAELRSPRKGQRLPQVLSRAEVGRLLAVPAGTE
ncbi:MAG: site-specific integrase, partial [Solirubrobacterales bacterium]|nr:site-specific integrase [Solirubrobacterales bacterium]